MRMIRIKSIIMSLAIPEGTTLCDYRKKLLCIVYRPTKIYTYTQSAVYIQLYIHGIRESCDWKANPVCYTLMYVTIKYIYNIYVVELMLLVLVVHYTSSLTESLLGGMN